MAEKLKTTEWKKIREELHKDPERYGLPERQYGTVSIASFNIRKLGKVGGTGRDEPTMHFLADVCSHFDLLAIQEVMPEMTGIRKLRELMGPEYGLIVSDIVGTFPGERGNEERLAFLYNRAIVRRSELVTEVSTSRTKLLQAIALHHQYLFDLMENNATAADLREFYEKTMPEFRKKRAAGGNPKEPKSPKFKVDVKHFMQFIRTPFAAGFTIHGHPGLQNYDLLAVNAHLHFGKLHDRRNEAAALVEWILGKARDDEAPNVLLLGDLNFDLDNPKNDLKRVLRRFEEIGGLRGGKHKVYVSFPFIFPHPNPSQEHPKGTVFRSNIGLGQTYDQIGIFSRDERVGTHLESTPTGHEDKSKWGKQGVADYGVFNFANLFSRALNRGKTLDELTKTARSRFLDRFEHKVSDHMPIWLRLPLPIDMDGFPLRT